MLGITNDEFMPKSGSINQSTNKTIIAIIKFLNLESPSLKENHLPYCVNSTIGLLLL